MALQAPAPAIFPEVTDDSIALASPRLNYLRGDWETVDTLWGGTQSMRLAGERFLPKEPLEKDEDYLRRLKRTTLHNYYRRTISSGTSKIFTKDPHFEDSPQEIVDFAQDVDTQGRAVGQFAKEQLEDALNHGISCIVVDYATTPKDYANLAEERAAGNKPYWKIVPITKVLDIRYAKFSDGERLSFFKYEESVVEGDLLGTQTYRQIRIYAQEPGPVVDGPILFAVYRREGPESGGGQWKLRDWGIVKPLTSIPVSPVYTNKVGFFLGAPPLMDLAEINIEHWQHKSDYANILHVVTVPILLLKGFTPEMDEKGKPVKMTVAPNAALSTANKDADAKWVEHGGKAIDAARQNLKDIEQRMDALGMVLTANQNAGVSATANVINTAEANSMLKSAALNLQDAYNAALAHTATFLGIENAGRIIINTEYAVDYTTNETMSDVLKAFELGVIGAEVVIQEGKRRNVFDNAAEIEPPAIAPVKEAAPNPVTP